MSAMDLTHHLSVPASLDDTWAVFAQPQRLAPCFPGATVVNADGDDFTGSIKVKLGPLALVYEGAGRYVKRDVAARRLEIEFQGADKRGHGAAEGTVIAAFTAKGDTTEIEVHTDLRITGKPEQFGPSVLTDVNDRVLDQFANCISSRFADGSLLAAEPDITEFVDESDAATIDFSTAPAEVPAESDSGSGEQTRGDLAPGSASSPPVSNVEARPVPNAATPKPAPRPAEQPSAWVPATNFAETDFDTLRRVITPLLKRYWPFLGGAGLAAFVAGRIGAARKKKRR